MPQRINHILTDEAAAILKAGKINVVKFELSEKRGQRITGTDLTSLLDLNDYKTKYQLIAEKIGITQPEPVTSDQASIGLYLEGFLLSRAILEHQAMFEEWIGEGKTVEISMGEFMECDELDRFGCSMDAIVWVDEEATLSWEFKTTAQFWDFIPLKVHAQVQGQLMCNGLNSCQVYWIDRTHLVKSDSIIADPDWVETIKKAVAWGLAWIDRKTVPEPAKPEVRTPVPQVKGKKPVFALDDDADAVEKAETLKAVVKEVADLEAALEKAKARKEELAKAVSNKKEYGSRVTVGNVTISQSDRVFGSGKAYKELARALTHRVLQEAGTKGKNHLAETEKWLQELEKANTNPGMKKTLFDVEVVEDSDDVFAIE